MFSSGLQLQHIFYKGFLRFRRKGKGYDIPQTQRLDFKSTNQTFECLLSLPTHVKIFNRNAIPTENSHKNSPNKSQTTKFHLIVKAFKM